MIAAGPRFAIPSIPGLDEAGLWTAYDVIQLVKLPKSMVVIGGGAVGCDLGKALARVRVKVTLVEAADRPLRAEQPEASEAVTTAIGAAGIDMYTGAAVQRRDVG